MNSIQGLTKEELGNRYLNKLESIFVNVLENKTKEQAGNTGNDKQIKSVGLDGDLKNTKIYGYGYTSSKGKETVVNINSLNWSKLLITISETLYEVDRDIFKSFVGDVELNGVSKQSGLIPYFERDTMSISQPYKIDEDMYMRVALDAEPMCELISKMVERYGLDREQFKVYIDIS